MTARRAEIIYPHLLIHQGYSHRPPLITVLEWKVVIRTSWFWLLTLTYCRDMRNIPIFHFKFKKKQKTTNPLCAWLLMRSLDISTEHIIIWNKISSGWMCGMCSKLTLRKVEERTSPKLNTKHSNNIIKTKPSIFFSLNNSLPFAVSESSTCWSPESSPVKFSAVQWHKHK